MAEAGVRLAFGLPRREAVVWALPSCLGLLVRVLTADPQAGWWMPWVVGDTWELFLHKSVGPVQETCWSPAAFALASGWETQRKPKHKRRLWVWEGVQMAETDTSGRNVGS